MNSKPFAFPRSPIFCGWLLILSTFVISGSMKAQEPFVLGPSTQSNTNGFFRTPVQNPGSPMNRGSLGGLPPSTPQTSPGFSTQGSPTQGSPTQGSPTQGSPTQGSPTQGISSQSFRQSPQDNGTQVASRTNNVRTNPVATAGTEFKPGTVVANVGGYPIFRGDVMADINQLIEANLAGAPESVKQQQREMALPIVVDRAIEQKLLFVDAIRSLPDPDKLPEIRKSIRDQFTEIRLPELLKNLKVKNPAEAEAKLRTLGTSLRQARDSWVDGQLAGFFARDKVNMNPEVTHFEMLEYYNAHRDDYHTPAKVRWEQIMVRFDKFDSREQAWEQLGKLGNEVVYGANFSAVAKKSSHGFEADKGGYHDWTTKGSLVHDKVDEMLFSLPTNVLSDRIESKIGFHIVRVIERKDEGFVPFSKCQTEIRKKIQTEKQNVALKEYVEKLKKEIPFEKYIESKTPARKPQ